MSTEETQVLLLTEIRDLQREHLELYRKNSAMAIAKQEQALNITRRFQRLYRVVVVIVFLAIAILMFWLFK